MEGTCSLLSDFLFWRPSLLMIAFGDRERSLLVGALQNSGITIYSKVFVPEKITSVHKDSSPFLKISILYICK